MPEFANPFSGAVPKKLSLEELIRALRLDLSAEEEAVHLYEAHANATDNELAKRVLHDVANEEREHIGEFQRLLNILAADEETLLSNGAEEVNEMAAELAGEPVKAQEEEEKETQPTAKRIPTIGNMR